jgi:hypothetical protein
LDPDEACSGCDGAGYKAYGDTSTFWGGIGGQTITSGVCNECWGSGSRINPWPDHRKPQINERDLREIERRVWNSAIDAAVSYAKDCTFGWDMDTWRDMTKSELVCDTCHKVGDGIKDMKK